MMVFIGVDGGANEGRAGLAKTASDPDTARPNILAATRAALSNAVAPTEVEAELPRLIAGLGLAGANAAGAVGRHRLGRSILSRARRAVDRFSPTPPRLADLTAERASHAAFAQTARPAALASQLFVSQGPARGTALDGDRLLNRGAG